ncbi:MAG: hypothetical protein KDB46_13840 [Solirubrobacterales bacterium]|nr:hypothetical protein [Solirubrobacterales bacterium]
MLALVPQEEKEQAVARCFRLMDRAKEKPATPPGFSISGSGQSWTVTPPPEIGDRHVIVATISHPLREFAVAFAWELAEGRVDYYAAEHVAREVMRKVVAAEGGTPEGVDEDTVIALGSLSLIAELLTGYYLVAETIESDPETRALLGPPLKGRPR